MIKTDKIITNFVDDYPSDNYPSFIDRNPINLEKGLQSFTFYLPSDPNSVYKVISVMDSWEDEPIIQYLSLCMEFKNSYFPKIYSVNYYKVNGKVGGDFIIVHMERLFDYFNFESFYRSELIRIGLDYYKLNFEDLDASSEQFSEYMRIEFGKIEELINVIKDEELKFALVLLKDLFKEFGPDLEFKNIMVRDDHGDKHLVLTDPISPHPVHYT